MTRNGQFNATFDYDGEPFEGDADPDAMWDDHQMYPRANENLPDWHPAKSA